MIKSLFSRNNNSIALTKPSRRGKSSQNNQMILENPSYIKTPKKSGRMIVERPPVTIKKPLQPIENRNQIWRPIPNKENDHPHRSTRNQKPIVFPSKNQSQQRDCMVIEEDNTEEIKTKEEPTYYEKVVEPIEIEVGPLLDLDLLLEVEYGQDIEDCIFSAQPDFSKCLQHTEIKHSLRAKMIDWVIEVFGNYAKSTSHHTFFLAIGILDLYFKNAPKKLKDSDVHLSGVAAMFMATKYEDIYHIPLKDFVERVAHNKFSAEEIKAKEWEIFKALDCNINFATTLNYLERVIYKNFHEDNCNMLKNIKETAIHILKMCLYEYSLLNYKPLTTALAVLCYCIKCYFHSLSEENSKNGNPIDLTEQEHTLLQNIVFGCQCVTLQEVEDCLHEIYDLIHSFETKFPDLQNLKKFSDLKK